MNRLRFLLILGLTVFVSAGPGCSSGDSGSPEVPGLDFGNGGDLPDATSPDTIAESATPDGGGDASEVLPPGDAGADLPANQPPGFDALAPVAVRMGHVVEVDLNGAIDDAEDADPALVLTWSSVHVALADDGSHVLTVVGPTDWFGDEVIELTVTDTAGASATSFLTVTVQEVRPPEPPVECPKTLFSYAAPAGTQEVLLSGSFNGWAGPGASELALADLDGDHTWTLEVALAGGHYLYKFIVDGAWVPDPANPDTVDDGYGGKNSVLDVPVCPGGED